MYDEKVEIYEEDYIEEGPKDTGPWKVFAIIGMILGIASIALAFIAICSAFVADYEGYASYMYTYGDDYATSYTAMFTFFAAPVYAMSFAFTTGIPGLIFSILGRKSINNKGKAVTGIILSPIGMALAGLAYIILIALMVSAIM